MPADVYFLPHEQCAHAAEIRGRLQPVATHVVTDLSVADGEAAVAIAGPGS